MIRSGFKTTEFWGKLAVQICLLLMAVFQQQTAWWAAPAAAVMEIIYQALRTRLKLQALAPSVSVASSGGDAVLTVGPVLPK